MTRPAEIDDLIPVALSGQHWRLAFVRPDVHASTDVGRMHTIVISRLIAPQHVAIGSGG